MSIRSILRGKPEGVVSVAPADSIEAVCHVLTRRGIGAALVLDGEGRLVGVLSERDVVGGIAAYGAAALGKTANQLMTPPRHTVTPETSVTDAMETMTSARVRHLPVLEADRLVGVVSIGDVVKERLEQQAHEVDSLRDYVAGQG